MYSNYIVFRNHLLMLMLNYITKKIKVTQKKKKKKAESLGSRQMGLPRLLAKARELLNMQP